MSEKEPVIVVAGDVTYDGTYLDLNRNDCQTSGKRRGDSIY